MVQSRTLLVTAYSIGVIGAFLQIAGGYWDVSWHNLGMVESFFGPNHVPLYAGVVLVLLVSLYGLFLRFTTFKKSDERNLLTGFHVALVGGALQIIAGPTDAWWHETFGFDPFLFTPTHSLLIAGIILAGFGMAMGSVRLLQAYNAKRLTTGIFPHRWLQFLPILALTALWLDLNTLVYTITDVEGIAYTLQLGQGFVDRYDNISFRLGVILVAATGTLIFFTTKKLLNWRGSVLSVAIISAVVSATANLGFRASILGGSGEGPAIVAFIPLYLAFLIPVLIFDLLLNDTSVNRKMIIAAILISPFASFLDGWNSLGLWMFFRGLIPILIVPIVVAGLLGALAGNRFANILGSSSAGDKPKK